MPQSAMQYVDVYYVLHAVDIGSGGARDAHEQAQQIRAVLFTSGNGDRVGAMKAVETKPQRRVPAPTRATPRGNRAVRRQKGARRRAKS